MFQSVVAVGPRDRDWLVPATAITAISLAIGAAIGAHRPSLLGYGFLAYFCFAVWAMGRFAWAFARMVIEREQRPLRRIGEMLRSAAPRAVSIIIGVQVVTLFLWAFTALKQAIPSVVPYWADIPISRLEIFLFGAPAWTITHAALGWATPIIDAYYASWAIIQTIALFTIMAWKPSAFKTQALVSFMLAWLVIGVIMACLLSSVGPIFYDRAFGGTEYAGLADALRDAPAATAASDHLWRTYLSGSSEIANGISAMPSLHVAMALWVALLFRQTRLAPFVWAYFAAIWIGSVHLGWHYATDGLVGAVAMLLIWRAVRRPSRTSQGYASSHIPPPASPPT